MNTQLFPANVVLAEVEQLLKDAFAAGDPEADAVVLATVGVDGHPSSRAVNLQFSDGQPSFFVRQFSGKWQQLQQNPFISLCCYWKQIRMQVVIEGVAQRLEPEAANALWRLRPRSGQIVASVSTQQKNTTERNLRRKVSENRPFSEVLAIPRPPDWLAYSILPKRIAIWPSGWQRAQLRREYRLQHNGSYLLSHYDP